MVSAGDFRNGMTFEMDSNIFTIVEFQHVKPGKGAAFVRTKLKNVISGAVVEKTFNPTDKFPTAYIERKDMQYLYNDASSIILWIRKPMSRCRLMQPTLATISSLSKKIPIARYYPTKAMSLE